MTILQLTSSLTTEREPEGAVDPRTIQKIVDKADEITRSIRLFTVTYILLGLIALAISFFVSVLLNFSVALITFGVLLLVVWFSLGYTRRYVKRAIKWYDYWTNVVDRMEDHDGSFTSDEWSQFSIRLNREFEDSITAYKL